MAALKLERENTAGQRNDALIGARKDALEKTYEAKKMRAQSRLDRASDLRIIRMHEGEIRNLEVKLQMQLEELESRRIVSVTYEPVAQGLVRLQ